MKALIDSHAHLHEVYPTDKAIENARELGIKHIVAVGMDLDSNKKTLALAKEYPGMVLPSIGYHPWLIKEKEVDENLAFIETHLERCIALGEVGLDYKVKVKKPLQFEVLSQTLQLAKEKEKPVILHSRFSHKRTHAMVSDAGIKKVVFHWYSGPIEILEKIINDGYYISATPALAYSPPHSAAITNMPLEKILIETDSPVAYQGKVSDPSHLLDTLHHLSVLKNMPKKKLAEITTKNAKNFFEF